MALFMFVRELSGNCLQCNLSVFDLVECPFTDIEISVKFEINLLLLL